MAIKFGGDFEIQRTREEVYDFLTDPNKFGPLLPDFQGMSVLDPTHFTVKVSVGVSHIRGTAEVRLELQEAQRPSRAQYRGQGNVPGGNATVIASFDLSEVPGGTRVAWSGEAQIFGKLISVAGGLLEPLGRKNIQKLIGTLQTALQPGQSAQGQTSAAPPPAQNTGAA